MTIPYRAHVLSGQLFVNESVTHFHLKDRWGYNTDEAEIRLAPSSIGETTGNTKYTSNDNDDYLGVNHHGGDDTDFFADLDEEDIEEKPPSSSEWTLNTDYYNKMTRNITIMNRFKVAVAIHNVSLAPEAERFFTIDAPFTPTVLQAGKSSNLVVLSLKPEAWTRGRTLNSHMTVHTNISSINIPLLCFHGRVEKFFPGSPSQKNLDYGTLGMSEKRDHFFTILNRNPITLHLKSWGANLTGSLVELMGVESGNESDILRRANFSDMNRQFKIPPGHYMVFRVGIFTPNAEGETNGTVFVETDYHSFRVPFKFRVAKGSLNTVPRELIFEPTFPVNKNDINIHSFWSVYNNSNQNQLPN